jgi:hypothetical protein
VLLLWFSILHVPKSNIVYIVVCVISRSVPFQCSPDIDCGFSAATSKRSVDKKVNYHPTNLLPACNTAINIVTCPGFCN